MNNSELENLSRHLGHDSKTHKEFYRLSHSTVQLSKVSKNSAELYFYIFTFSFVCVSRSHGFHTLRVSIGCSMLNSDIIVKVLGSPMVFNLT